MPFDPSTAVAVEDAPKGFDPSTAVEISGFDPSTAVETTPSLRPSVSAPGQSPLLPSGETQDLPQVFPAREQSLAELRKPRQPAEIPLPNEAQQREMLTGVPQPEAEIQPIGKERTILRGASSGVAAVLNRPEYLAAMMNPATATAVGLTFAPTIIKQFFEDLGKASQGDNEALGRAAIIGVPALFGVVKKGRTITERLNAQAALETAQKASSTAHIDELARIELQPPTLLKRSDAELAKIPGERKSDASQIGETAEVHGPLRTQPIPSEEQVPVEEGGAGVQPQAERGIPRQDDAAAKEAAANLPRNVEEPKWFNASHNILEQFETRPVKSVDSLGTWVTSSKENARTLYGPNVHQVDVGQPRLLEFDGSDPTQTDFNSVIGSNARLAREAGFTSEADILDKTIADTTRLNELERRFNQDERLSARETTELKALRAADKASHKLLNSPAYMSAFRAMIEGEGYEGILWKNSRIDTRASDPSHDVAVIFHKAPLKAKLATKTADVGGAGDVREALGKRKTAKEVIPNEEAKTQEAGKEVLSPDEAVTAPTIGQGPGARTATESAKPEAPESYEGTGLKNAIGDLERISYGFAERTPTEKQNMAEAWVRAGDTLQRNSEAGRRLQASLEANPKRGLTADESALLLRHKVNLENALNDAAERTITEKDPALKAEASADVIRTRDELNRFLNAIAERGSEWGMEGRWRQALAYEDYTFATQERLLRASKGGADLTTPETEALMRQVAEHKAKSEELAQHLKTEEEKSARLESERLLAEERAKTAEQALPPPQVLRFIGEVRKSVKAAADKSRDYFKGKSLSLSPEDLYHLSRIALDNLFEIGENFAKWSEKMAVDLGAFYEQVKPHLQKLFDDAKAARYEPVEGKRIPKTPKTEKALEKPSPELQRAKVIDALKESKAEGFEEGELGKYIKTIVKQVVESGIEEYDAVFAETAKILKEAGVDLPVDQIAKEYSDYGKSTPAPTDPVKVRLSQLRGEAQKASGLKTVLEKNTPPEATGPRRVKVSDLYRRTVAKINEAMKRLGIVVGDPAKQLADSLQARKTYRQNRIKDLRHELATGERIVNGKTKPLTDAELTALDAEYQQLRREHAARFPKEPPTELEMIAQESKSLDREIASLEDQIKTGNVLPKESKSKPTTPELEAKRARLEALRDQREEMRGLNEEFQRRKELEDLQRKKLALQKDIDDKTQQLKSGDLETKAQPVSRPAHPELEPLLKQRDELNRQLAEARKPSEEEKAATKLANDIEATQKRIAAVEEKFATGDLSSTKPRVNRPAPPELEIEKQKLDALNKRLAEARKKPADVKAAEQQARKVEAINKRIEEVESKIAAKDLTTKGQPVNRPLPPELEMARQRLDEVNKRMHDLRNPKKTPEELALNAYKSSRSRRIADLTDRLAKGDFTPKTKTKTTPKLDAEAIRLDTELKAIEQKFAEERLKNERALRTPFEKLQDTIVDWSRGVKLLSLRVFPKLVVAGLTRIVTNPIYRLAGQPLRLIPGLKAKAPTELGLSLSAEAKNLGAILSSGPQAWRKLVKGKSNLDTLEGKLSRSREMSGLIGNAHGMIKEPVRQGQYARAIELRTQNAINEGLNPAEPAVASSIVSSSLADARREIFMNDNMFTKYLVRLPVNALRQSGKTGAKSIANVIEFLLPIVNVPTNITIAGARLNPAIGFGEALARLARATKRGELENRAAKLSEADAESIARAFKYGAVGTFLSAYAWLNPDQFGGVYDEKGKKRPLKPGQVKIMGITTPGWLGHSPEFAHLNTVAAARRVYDRYYKSGEGNAAVEALAFSLMAPVKNLPFIDGYLRLFNTYHSPGQTMGSVIRDATIPTSALRVFDEQERSPKTFWQEIELGIPGLWSNVPKKKVPGEIHP